MFMDAVGCEILVHLGLKVFPDRRRGGEIKVRTGAPFVRGVEGGIAEARVSCRDIG